MHKPMAYSNENILLESDISSSNSIYLVCGEGGFSEAILY